MIKIAGIKSNDKINFKEFVDFFYKIDWAKTIKEHYFWFKSLSKTLNLLSNIIIITLSWPIVKFTASVYYKRRPGEAIYAGQVFILPFFRELLKLQASVP